jgi:hypothetical protein
MDDRRHVDARRRRRGRMVSAARAAGELPEVLGGDAVLLADPHGGQAAVTDVPADRAHVQSEHGRDVVG